MGKDGINELDGIDGLGNTAATASAATGSWEEVKRLLAEGADVRSCNCFGQNALYFALVDGEFDLAMALFDAGARLDELAVGDQDRYSLSAAAEMRRTGRDVFDAVDKSVANLCRNGAYEEAEKHLEGSSPAECGAALNELIRNGRYRPEVNLALAEKLFAAGGRVDPALVTRYAEIRPHQLRNPEDYTAQIRRLTEKYQGN